MSRKLVVIGMSGRALAQSAAKSGERVVVLDVFADRDTRAVAEVACIAADDCVAIDPERLLAALAAEARGCELDVVIGSGLEQAPELLSRVAPYGRLYANDAGIISACKDPGLGIALLRATGWSVPTTQREPPDDRRGWLQKEVGGAGGVHVRHAGDAGGGPRVYFQREVRGRPMSVTFLADGECAHLLGFNRLRIEALGEAAFCYAGAVAGANLAPVLRRQVQSRLDRLVRLTGLRGLAGLDFLLDGEEMIALEVNPRPTATFELYDDDFREGLVRWHKLSFERSVPELGERLGGQCGACRALGVIYAPCPISIPPNAVFPAWCRDLPGPGNTIAAGAPVLSVFAEGATVEAAEREIDARGDTVRALLERWRVADRRAVAGGVTVSTAIQETAAKVSVNALAAPRVAELIAAAARLRLGVSASERGATIVDAGIAVRGGLEAGRRIAEICMGGLGSVQLASGDGELGGLTQVEVHSVDPVIACLASQYAGWSLAHGEGKGAFHALASGPGRAIARREPLFDELGYADRFDRAAFVLEVDRVPPETIIDKIARGCALAPERITVVLTPTTSLAGTVQIVARALEVAMHKAHALGFALDRIVDGTGAAPLPPPAADFLAAMGRTNDAILFGGRVMLYVDAADADAERLAQTLPAAASRDYGRPFAQVFKDYQFDFYKIDPMLFAPAEVIVCNLASGRSFRGGKRDLARLAESFGV